MPDSSNYNYRTGAFAEFKAPKITTHEPLPYEPAPAPEPISREVVTYHPREPYEPGEREVIDQPVTLLHPPQPYELELRPEVSRQVTTYNWLTIEPPEPGLHAPGDVMGRTWGLPAGWEAASGGAGGGLNAVAHDTTMTGTGQAIDPLSVIPATGAQRGAVSVPARSGAQGLLLAGEVLTLPTATAALMGGVTVPARAAGQGLNLTAAGVLTAPIATAALAGVLLDAPSDGVTRGRLNGGWAPIAGGMTYTFDVGLIEAPPGNVLLDTAGTSVATRGGVGVPARSDTQGLQNTLGLLTAPLATPTLAGTIVDAPVDGQVYCRIDSGWIDFRLALGAPLISSVPARSNVQGLALAAGVLTAPLATPLLAGSMVDAPADGRVYTRASGRWAPAALGAVFTHLAPITLLGDDTVNAAAPRYMVTVPQTALPDIAIVYAVSGGGIGTMFTSNVGAGPIGAVPGSMGWGFFIEEVFNSGNWIPCGSPGSLALLNVAEPTLVKSAGGTNRLLSYDPASGNGIRIGFGMTGGTNAGFPPVSLFIGIEGQILFAA
jgi:hypothetical protein